MRFSPFGHQAFRDTHRKRLAVLRRQAQERARYPLFADAVAAEQADVDTEMAQRRAAWSALEVENRMHRARKWREARRRLAQFPPGDQAELRAYWQRCSWPGDPEYLLSLMRSYEQGWIDLHPTLLRQSDAQRTAVRALAARLTQEVAARRAGGAALS